MIFTHREVRVSVCRVRAVRLVMDAILSDDERSNGKHLAT
jgi:hypothetical protein